MRDFHKLDLNALRAFYFATDTLNFTHAARRAGLTQSGVSQHIQKLESELGTSLFLRVKKELRLTEAGIHLKSFAEKYLDEVEGLLSHLQSKEKALSGLVRYAMPSSCLLSPHFEILLQKRKAFPNIDLSVNILYSEKVVEGLLQGLFDFGFVTKKIPHNELIYEEFVLEEFVLVGPSGEKARIQKFDDFNDRNFISYLGMEVLAEAWVKKQFPKERNFDFSQLKVRSQIDAIEGAKTLVRSHVGLGFFPFHCVVQELKSKTLSLVYGPSQQNPLNPVYIVSLKQHNKPERVQRVLDAFWEMKKIALKLYLKTPRFS